MQNVKISQLSLFLGIRFKFSVMFNWVNLQRGNVFTVVFVIYIAIEIIVIISIIKILEILLSHSPTVNENNTDIWNTLKMYTWMYIHIHTCTHIHTFASMDACTYKAFGCKVTTPTQWSYIVLVGEGMYTMCAKGKQQANNTTQCILTILEMP